MKVIAINALERAKGSDPEKVAPGDILELTGKELKIAQAAGAVREPTEDEVLLHDARKAKAQADAAAAADEDADEKTPAPKKSAAKGKSTKKNDSETTGSETDEGGTGGSEEGGSGGGADDLDLSE